MCSFGLLCGAGSVRQQDERHLLLLEHGQGFYGTCGDRRRGVSRGGLQVRTLAAQHRGADGAQQAYLGARGRRGRCSPRRRSRRRSCAPRRRRSAAGAALSRHGRSAAQGVWQAPAFRALQRQQRDRRTRLTVALRWIHPALRIRPLNFAPSLLADCHDGDDEASTPPGAGQTTSANAPARRGWDTAQRPASAP